MRKRIAVFNDTSANAHFGCHAVMSTLNAKLAEVGAEVVLCWPVAEDWRPYKTRIARQRIDAVVVNGEGSVHAPDQRPRAQQLLELAPFCRDTLGVPCFLINSSVANLGPSAQDHFSAFTEIFVRETHSAALLSDLGVDATVVPDLSFAIALPELTNSRRRNGVLVTDSVLPETSKALQQAATAEGAQFVPFNDGRKQMKKVRRTLREASGYRLGMSSLAAHAFVLPFVEQCHSAVAIIAGRFHAMTLAMHIGTPFLALPSNTHKVTSVLSDVFGADAANFRLCDTPADAMSRLRREPSVSAWSSEEMATLHAYRERATAHSDAMIRRIVGGTA